MTIRRVRVDLSGVSVAGGGLATFYFTSTEGTAQDCVDAVADLLGTIDGSLSNTMSWATEADVATIAQETGELVGTDATSPQTGAGASSATILPPATQGLIQWRTGAVVSGRTLRGRTFLPGITTSLQDGGAPTSAFRTTVLGACNTFVTDASVTPIIWSKAHGVAAPIASGDLWTKFSVLRSRRD